ncbi:MAG: hypothetical protein AAF197_00385 [Pseudomonadota bacterium]
MLNPFGTKAKLKRAVEQLCILNDKGWVIEPRELDNARDKALIEINSLINSMGESELPVGFLGAVDNGDIREEQEGKYLRELTSHFSRK